MRLNIKTKTPVKDKDIKALYILQHAMEISTDRMRQANLQYIADKWGFMVIPTKMRNE